MTNEHYKQIIKESNQTNDETYSRLYWFLMMLKANKVALKDIERNDWPNNTEPAIYLTKKGKNNYGGHLNMKRYVRCSPRDLKSALKFYNS